MRLLPYASPLQNDVCSLNVLQAIQLSCSWPSSCDFQKRRKIYVIKDNRCDTPAVTSISLQT